MVERDEIEGADMGVIALDVSLDEYMEVYAAQHCEWVEGVVIKVSPSKLEHVRLIQYFVMLINAYLEIKPVGTLVVQPFVIRLPEFPRRRREPDLFVVLKSNPNELKDAYMDGAPDLCIEIVSEDSVARDHGDKFYEYQTGRVPEYWVIDPLRKQCRFYRLDDEGRYTRISEDADGNYQAHTLTGLRIHVPTLWQAELPGISKIVQAVHTMLNADE